MKAIKIYLISFICVFFQILHAQDNPFSSYTVPTPNTTAFLKHVDVPVDMSRGLANISIPLHHMGQGDISIPITLSYNSSGIKVGETASWVGMNWSLNVGGVIHRTIKGVPDEHPGGYFTTASSVASGFEYEEPTDFTVNQIANGYWDGEPDLFSFSFPGYSGKFYINSDMKPVLVPQQDLRIEFVWDGLSPDSEKLQKFIITAANGVKYHFGKNDQTGELIVDYHQSAPSGSGNDSNWNSYWDAPVAWHLTKIESQTHENHYYIEYIKQVFEYHSLSVSYHGKYKGTLAQHENNPNFVPSTSEVVDDYDGNESTTYVPFRITCAKTNESVQFNAITDREDLRQSSSHKGKRLDRINIRNSKGIVCKKIEFNYDYYQTENYDASTAKFSDKRLRLKSIQESSCDGLIDDIPPYTFEYNSKIFPSVTSRAIDHWGYYNGQHGNEYSNLSTNPKLNIPPTTLEYAAYPPTEYYTIGEANRDSDEVFMLQGMLEKITYPTGGFHKFEFEANSYNDSDLGNTICGGLRIKKIEINSGDNTSPPIVKQYTYPNSGTLIQKPIYGRELNASHSNNACFGISPCNLTVTFLSWTDAGLHPLSSFEGYHIYYSTVRETSADNSYKENQFYSYSNPQPNVGKFPVIPFTYFPDSGKSLREKLYNDTGEQVGEINYNYKRKLNAESEILVQVKGIPYSLSMDGEGVACCHNISGAVFLYSTYRVYTGYSLIEEKSSVIDGITKLESFEYRDDDKHLFPIKHRLLDPVMGTAIKVSDIKYAEEAQQTNFIASQMVSRHLIGLPLETRIMDGDGGGSKVDYDLIGNYFKPIKYYSATSGSNYHMGVGDSPNWKLMVEASYEAGSDFPTSLRNRNAKLPISYEWENYDLLSKTSHGTREWSYSYNDHRQLESITNNEGIISEFTFDQIGRLKKSVVDKTSIEDEGRKIIDVIYSYQDENKLMTKETFKDGTPSLSFEKVYDGLGRLIENRKLEYTQSSQDYIVSTSYNNVGLVEKECEPSKGGCTFYVYEKSPLRRLIEIKPAGTLKSIFKTYTPEGSFQKITTIDENGNFSSEVIDVLGRKRKTYDGLGAVTVFSYDDRDQLTSVVPPGAQSPFIYTYNYYDDGLLKDKAIPDKGTYTYEYTIEDQLDKEILPNTTTLNYIYDDNYNSFLKEVRDNSSAVLKRNIPIDLGISDRVLKEEARVLTPTGLGGWVSHQYNYYPLGLLKNSLSLGIDGSIVENDYTYDSNNNITSEIKNITGPDGIALPESSKTYFYPKGIRLNKTTLSYGNQDNLVLNELNYNDKDFLITRTIGNGLQTINYEYNARGWLNKINSIRETFDYGKACLPPPPEECDEDRTKTKLLRVSYNQDKILSKSPTAINLSFSHYEHIGRERILSGSDFQIIPLNNFSQEKEYDTNSIKDIYLQENDTIGQILTILNQELSFYLENYTNEEKDILWSNLSLKTSQGLSTNTSEFDGKLFGMEIFYDRPNPALDAQSQYNGNIAWFKWRVKGEEVQAYGFNYDANSRLRTANYASSQGDYCSLIANSNYDVTIAGYDPRGNILGISRKGLVDVVDDVPQYGLIDNLSYTGYTNGSNLLLSISDVGNEKGFTGSSSFGYDNNGNLTSDSGKGLNNVSYNYLDLPTQLFFDEGQIHNYYDANGNKLKSVVIENGEETITRHYVGNAEYKNSLIQSVFNEEGRYVYERSPEGELLKEYFEYFITDHLGNNRVRFADLNNDGEIQVLGDDSENDELISSYHYYPFGMRMEGIWANSSGEENRDQYNGKELIKDLELNWMDYEARWYDPAIGRMTTIDPHSENYFNTSAFAYGGNNPISIIDPDGKDIIQVTGGVKFTGEDAQRMFREFIANSKDIKAIHFVYEEHTKTIYDNTLNAFKEGKSNVLTYDSDKKNQVKRRTAALKNHPSVAGFERDEYPYASTTEGGAGASVVYVKKKEHKIQAGQLGLLSQLINSGDKFMVVPVPTKDTDQPKVPKEVLGVAKRNTTTRKMRSKTRIRQLKNGTKRATIWLLEKAASRIPIIIWQDPALFPQGSNNGSK